MCYLGGLITKYIVFRLKECLSSIFVGIGLKSILEYKLVISVFSD